MMRKLLFIIWLLLLAVRVDAVVFNSNTMIDVTTSPYNAVGTSTPGTNLLTGWTNGSPGYDTLTSTGNVISSLINTAGTAESCYSNTITTVSGSWYAINIYNSNSSGQLPALSGTGGFPTTALIPGWNYIQWQATGTSCIVTLTNTLAANNQFNSFSGPKVFLMTDNATALASAVTDAKAAGKDLYFYGFFYSSTTNWSAIGVNLVGADRLTSGIIAPNGYSSYTHIQGASDITLTNLCIGGSNVSAGDYVFKNIVYNAPSGVNYPVEFENSSAAPVDNCVNFKSINSVFNSSSANNTYELLYFYQTYNVLIEDSVFNGYSSHGPINFSAPLIGSKVVVRGNRIYGGGSITGIFFPANRGWPFEDVVIENNKIYDISQEAIAPDGLGNNAGGCPTIANGPIASVSNDGNGRLVVSMADMLYYYSTANQAFSVATWISQNPSYPLTNFYFTLGQGSGQEGTVAKVYDYSSANNTVTLNCFIPAADVTIGGDCGIQSGFFNFKIKGNWLENCGTAISLYLNCFGFDVEGNTAIGCTNGISVLGGLMLSTYYTLAYNNLIQGNTFINCGSSIPYPTYQVNGAVSFFSDYTTRKQYGNRFVNNIVRGGAVNIASQGKFTWTGNQIDPGTPVNWTP